MTARTKSALLLCATLVTGVLLGTLGTSALQNRRAMQIRETRERGGMTRLLEDVIRVEDEEQRHRVRAVIDQAETRFQQARTECRELMAARRDSLNADLEEILDPEQRQRLERWLSRDRESQRSRTRPPDGRQRRRSQRRHP